MHGRLRSLIASSNILSAVASRCAPGAALDFLIDIDHFERNNHAYIIHCAALTARSLGVPRISAIEFGVAGGSGLLHMEAIARKVEATTGVGIEVHGFDAGSGMPPPRDFRDAPHVWRASDFKMDVSELRRRLTRATLHIGDVGDTVPAFLASTHAPIGAISFDLDYYSSTMSAFEIFRDRSILPRVWCYFDDISESPPQSICSRAGERAAINDYNAQHQARMIDHDWSLASKQSWHAYQRWADRIRIWYDLEHAQAEHYVGSASQQALSLD